VFLEQLINGVTLGSIYAIVALGYTLVFGVLDIINMAHGRSSCSGRSSACSS